RRRPLLERRAGQRLARSVDFEVCFLPRKATRKPSPVTVLIDVIRASTTIVTLLDRGCSEVVLVGQKDRPRLAELRAKLDALVCAGREGSLIPALDDAYCAAALLRQGEALVRAAGATVSLRESAKIARNAASVFAGTHEAFDQSMSAAVIRRIGSPDDLGYCAEENV